MAKKLRTGFELPFSNTSGGDSSRYSFDNLSDYLFNGLLDGRISAATQNKYQPFSVSTDVSQIGCSFDTGARTLSNGTRGSQLVSQTDYMIPYFSASNFTSGFFANYWVKYQSIFASSSRQVTLFSITDGTNTFNVNYIKTLDTLYLSQVNGSTDRNTAALSLSTNTWYNCIISVSDSVATGRITVSLNGTSVTYDTGISFSSWTNIACCPCYTTNLDVDDLAINDGSGASDNSTPISIRGYNFFDAATLNSNTGFTAVGGTTVLANLQDGDDATRASASADLSNLDFSLPNLAGTGMSETAASFNKIECINVYARQIEATAAGAVLKAKIDDDTAVVSREESLTLPLTVGDDSVTMFNDGSSDWSLTNLDSGAFDFTVTFDKP